MIRRAGEEEKRWKEEEGTAKGDEAEVIPSWGHGLCREFPSTAYFTKQDIYMQSEDRCVALISTSPSASRT